MIRQPIGKLIHVRGHHPISVSRHDECIWADVWLSWTGKPGRTVYRSAPCIMSRVDLEHDIERNEWYLEQPEQESAIGGTLFNAEHKARIQEDLQQGRALLARLMKEPCVVDGEAGEAMPSAYVSASFLNRAVAEHALREIMKSLYGIALCRFKWRRSKLISIPA